MNQHTTEDIRRSRLGGYQRMRLEKASPFYRGAKVSELEPYPFNQEFAKFFLITEMWPIMWVPTSGVQKVWTSLKLVCIQLVWKKFQVSFSSSNLQI